MSLRKKAIDNNVKHVSKTILLQSKNSHDPEQKTASLLRKQIKKLSQNNEKCSKNKTGERVETSR